MTRHRGRPLPILCRIRRHGRWVPVPGMPRAVVPGRSCDRCAPRLEVDPDDDADLEAIIAADVAAFLGDQ